MGTISILKTEVANQIAAGEVVERPASVIKELIENAIDAKACSIAIHIKHAGLDHIVVHDDGLGMDQDDIVLATKRYATSKLTCADELFSLSSFGFRGEALPSIASISHMSIISRTSAQEYATRIVLKAGELCEVSSASSPRGTRIEVRDLFFNVPARLKFVKTKRAEVAAIDRLIRAYAFCYPEVAWELTSDEHVLFSSPRAEKRAMALLGRDTEGKLHAVAESTELLRLRGVIVAPPLTRRDTRSIFIFVNNRLVDDRKLTQAVRISFRTLLEVGRNPIAALHIDIDPAEVDINVHPQKAEVRFVDERRVIAHIIRLLGDFLAGTPWLKSAPESEQRAFAPAPSLFRAPAPSGLFDLPPAPLTRPAAARALPFELSGKTSSLLPTRHYAELRVIGQVNRTYLLLEGDEGLVVVDQHAAHERLTFEKIRRQNRRLTSSALLIPQTLELQSSMMALFLDHADELHRLGIEAEAFSETHVVLRAMPDFIKKEDATTLFLDVLSELSELGRSYSLDSLYDGVCASIACHGSIRAGQRLSVQEIEALLRELDVIDFGAHCPHGRPVVKSFSESEMKKWFHRT